MWHLGGVPGSYLSVTCPVCKAGCEKFTVFLAYGQQFCPRRYILLLRRGEREVWERADLVHVVGPVCCQLLFGVLCTLRWFSASHWLCISCRRVAVSLISFLISESVQRSWSSCAFDTHVDPWQDLTDQLLRELRWLKIALWLARKRTEECKHNDIVLHIDVRTSNQVGKLTSMRSCNWP